MEESFTISLQEASYLRKTSDSPSFVERMNQNDLSETWYLCKDLAERRQKRMADYESKSDALA